VKDDERSGHPRSFRTDKNAGKVLKYLNNGAMVVQLNLDKETVKRSKLWPNNCVPNNHNAPAHKALSVKQFMAQNSVTEMEHSPYSPALVPNNFLLFLKIRSALNM
jgi:hypothetical protein